LSFTLIAIIIACIGLFGLVSYATEQRFKEISIRKVLGASVFTIIKLLSIDFLKLVGIAFIIAAPIAWFIMSKWLESFAYHVGITVWVFLLAAFIALIIAIVTVSLQSTRAALLNPAKSINA
jgi:putative ABC transport system permease protein